MKKYIYLVLSFCLLISCTTYRYEYIAPTTEAGKMCAMQCMSTKQMCYNSMGFQTQNNATMCHQQNSMSYQNCVARAQNHDDVKKCNPNPQYCPTNPNYYQCDESYRQCFATCGGTVNVFKNE